MMHGLHSSIEPGLSAAWTRQKSTWSLWSLKCSHIFTNSQSQSSLSLFRKSNSLFYQLSALKASINHTTSSRDDCIISILHWIEQATTLLQLITKVTQLHPLDTMCHARSTKTTPFIIKMDQSSASSTSSSEAVHTTTAPCHPEPIKAVRLHFLEPEPLPQYFC